LVVGFNLTFGPRHSAGLIGMPRRIYTYQAGRGFEIWNQLSTAGVAFQAVATLFFLWNVVRSLVRRQPAGAHPWGALTLAWPPRRPRPTPPRRPRWGGAAAPCGT